MELFCIANLMIAKWRLLTSALKESFEMVTNSEMEALLVDHGRKVEFSGRAVANNRLLKDSFTYDAETVCNSSLRS